jgi:hypothetical protein
MHSSQESLLSKGMEEKDLLRKTIGPNEPVSQNKPHSANSQPEDLLAPQYSGIPEFLLLKKGPEPKERRRDPCNFLGEVQGQHHP